MVIKGKELRDIYKVKFTELSDQLRGGEKEWVKDNLLYIYLSSQLPACFCILLEHQCLDYILWHFLALTLAHGGGSI